MSGFSPKVRTIIHQRAEWWCERCGLARGVQAHHRRARGMGSTRRPESNGASNAGWLCLPCHHWAETHREAARSEGWLLRQNDDPATIPVLYRGTLVVLDDLGNLTEVAA